MTEYLVTWDIHVFADNPVEAAREARKAQHPDTIALFFTVTEAETGDQTNVDLLDDHHPACTFTSPKLRTSQIGEK